MPLVRPTLAVFAVGAVLSTACAGQLHLLERGPTGGAATSSFWPPPPSTFVTAAEISDPTLSDAAARVARALRDAGYMETRWFPIGAGFCHGFAVSTRLERIDDDGSPFGARERWHPSYAEAPTLRWLRTARQPLLPAPGRYRSLLVAVTDLPVGPSDRAPKWTEDTAMEAVGIPDSIPTTDLPARSLPKSYQQGVFVYEYRSGSDDTAGTFVPASSAATKRTVASDVRL